MQSASEAALAHALRSSGRPVQGAEPLHAADRQTMSKPKNQPKTNVELVNHGVQQLRPLAQLFVLQALRNRSGIIAEYRFGQAQYAARSHRRPRD